jgi:FtsZ-binding cell division protein ZapB
MNTALATGIAVALISGLFGWAGTKFARRKEKADAAAIITATAVSLLAPLNSDISKLQGKVSTFEAELARATASIANLERDNRNLRSENTGLRKRVTSLETQIVGLGHTPVNGTPTVTERTTVETTTVTHEPPP